MLIKPALLSYREIAAPKRATLASRPSVVVRSGGLVLDCTCLSHAGGVEIVVIVPRRRRGRALQELLGVIARFARSWALGRIAADLGLKFHEVGETSAWRRSSSAIIGGWLEMVETTVTRTPRRCIASTSERKSPSPENSTIWSICWASSMASTASSMSILPFGRWHR